jgi:AcrR family transcriptional regulator
MSPRTKDQLKKLKQEREAQILLAALQLFGDKGYQNTSMDEIAKSAKLSKGLLYNYFTNKEDLLNKAVVFAFKDATELSAKMLEQHKNLPPEDLFKLVVDLYFTMLSEQQDLWKLTLSLSVQTSSIPSVHQTIIMIYKEMLGQLTYIFSLMEKKDPEKEALVFGALVDGISIQYMLYGKEYPLNDVKQIILNKYCNNQS